MFREYFRRGRLVALAAKNLDGRACRLGGPLLIVLARRTATTQEKHDKRRPESQITAQISVIHLLVHCTGGTPAFIQATAGSVLLGAQPKRRFSDRPVVISVVRHAGFPDEKHLGQGKSSASRHDSFLLLQNQLRHTPERAGVATGPRVTEPNGESTWFRKVRVTSAESPCRVEAPMEAPKVNGKFPLSMRQRNGHRSSVCVRLDWALLGPPEKKKTSHVPPNMKAWFERSGKTP